MKTDYILFGFRPQLSGIDRSVIYIDNNVIVKVEYTKFMGVYLDSK